MLLDSLAPVMIFSRKNFKDHMIAGVPSDICGLANPSVWITPELFVDVLKHCIKERKYTEENPCILIMDNHESHISVESLNLAKENGIIIVT